MSAKKVEGREPDAVRDPKSLEGFVSDYLNGYREHITSKDMDEIHTPQMFKAYPFAAGIFDMPNGTVVALLQKGSRPKYSAQTGDFEEILARLKDPDFDFMLVFPPFTAFDTEEAKRLARMDAERDLKSSRRLEMLTAAESHIADIHTDIQTVVDLNPWLDQQTLEQKNKLDRARELILELYNEVDMSREERFSDYMRQLSEAMAFDKGEMEEVAGEIAVRMETALEEMDARLNELQRAVTAGTGGSELSRSMKDMAKRLDTLECGGSTKELESAISLLQSGMKDMTRSFQAIEKEFKAQKADYAEVRETVQRDSKRTYNLNERITDLERASSNKDNGKETLAAVKALEGRLNVLEKNLKDISRKASRPEPESSKPVVTESPVVETMETTPDGKTVKKTVKRTTTKKTTRSK